MPRPWREPAGSAKCQKFPAYAASAAWIATYARDGHNAHVRGHWAYPWLKAVFADSVYDRLPVLLACFLLGLTLIIVRRLAGSTGFVLLPRRWVAIARTILPIHASNGRS